MGSVDPLTPLISYCLISNITDTIMPAQFTRPSSTFSASGGDRPCIDPFVDRATLDIAHGADPNLN